MQRRSRLPKGELLRNGTEAYESALTAYRHAKVSGQGANLESMLAEMRERFIRKPKKKEVKKPEAIRHSTVGYLEK